MRAVLLRCCLVLAGACHGRSEPASEPSREPSAGGEVATPMEPEPTAVTPAWESELEAAMRGQEEDASAFGTALMQSHCEQAFSLRDAICELSERICAIADEHPEAMDRCADAEARCARASERVADEC